MITIIPKKLIDLIEVFCSMDQQHSSLPDIIQETIRQGVSEEIITIPQANMLMGFTLEELKAFISALSMLDVVNDRRLKFFFGLLCYLIYLHEV